MTKKTLVGNINPEVLTFTVGKDVMLDLVLAEADCIGTAAHVTMLSKMPVKPAVITATERKKIIKELVNVLARVREGSFEIDVSDQDVHMALERELTTTLGDLGKKVHTARSRNDQISVDLRLYGKEQLIQMMKEVLALSGELLRFAFKNSSVPMVGRTHLQPAMPSTVGLWASAHAESLMDDMTVLKAAFDFNDRCPLGAAAGFGVPAPIDRKLTSKLLGFAEPVHNVLYATSSRGKCETVILSAIAQVMLSLSRLAEDIILYSMPEFGYFSLPEEYCTGSSIMPQKKNPDVLELVRAKSSTVHGYLVATMGIVNGLPTGYNRDLQETKEPFLEGMHVTRGCLRIMATMVKKMKADKKALKAGFNSDIYAADKAMELVAKGVPFRDAYDHVKVHLKELKGQNPSEVLKNRNHLGAPGGLDFDFLAARIETMKQQVRGNSRRYHNAISKLLGVKYPSLERG